MSILLTVNTIPHKVDGKCEGKIAVVWIVAIVYSGALSIDCKCKKNMVNICVRVVND